MTVRLTSIPAAMVGVLAMAFAVGADAGHFREERAVVPGGRGPNRLSVDVPLLVGGQPLRYASRAGATPTFLGGLGDLRLYDPSPLFTYQIKPAEKPLAMCGSAAMP